MNQAEYQQARLTLRIPPRTRLTLRIPPRAHKICILCQSDFVVPLPMPNINENDEPLATRCRRCRRSEKCSKCRKIKKRKHFKKESNPIQFYKTCACCRANDTLRIQQKRAQAEMQGEYMRILLVMYPLRLGITMKRTTLLQYWETSSFCKRLHIGRRHIASNLSGVFDEAAR
jgi:hypothetical protein